MCNLIFSKGISIISPQCRAVLQVLSSQNTTSGGQEPWGIVVYLVTWRGVQKCKFKQVDGAIESQCFACSTGHERKHHCYCLMLVGFSAYLKDVAQISDNLLSRA